MFAAATAVFTSLDLMLTAMRPLNWIAELSWRLFGTGHSDGATNDVGVRWWSRGSLPRVTATTLLLPPVNSQWSSSAAVIRWLTGLDGCSGLLLLVSS